MTFIRFLFVLALAVPLAVFMMYYLNKLMTEFKNNRIKENSRDRSSYIEYRENESKQDKGTVNKRIREKRKKTVNNDKSSYNNKYHHEDKREYDTGFRAAYDGYDSMRANFDNSKMKRKYEESLKRQDEDTGERSKQVKYKQTEENRTKSKRKRRKERRNKKKSREQ